jgi:hypothetical protein
MTYYQGFRDSKGIAQVRKVQFGRRIGLRRRGDLYNHSLGFEWGYGGSGPAQLALALLADTLGKGAQALKLHQEFKDRVVAKLPRDGRWQLSRAEILRTVLAIEGARAEVKESTRAKDWCDASVTPADHLQAAWDALQVGDFAQTERELDAAEEKLR